MPDQPSPAWRYQLLDEALLGFEDDSGARATTTLPGLLARLSHGQDTELTALQAHQQHPVHAFLVQIASIALTRAGAAQLEHDEATWRAMLVAAASKDGAGEEAFALVVDDLRKPAFLQPPVPEGDLMQLKNTHLRPSEELDVLITSKNHDSKIHRIESPRPEHWVYGLIALQTSQGFLGAGNYGVARMNGGFSSRPCVAFSSDQTAAARFVRDTRALLEARTDLLERGFGTHALGLVWCAPWDGTRSLQFQELDPYFIEVCRRVRLTRDSSGTTVAHRGSSKVARINGADAAGNTGDAWTPVSSKDGKALTMPEAGFTYDRVRAFMLGDEWQHGAAGKQAHSGTDRYWLGQVLVRGQGKTGGYHERWIPIPKKARALLSRPDARARIAQRAVDWVATAGEVRLKVLKPAVLALLQGGPEKLKFDDDRANPVLDRFGDAVDQMFFATLFELADASAEDAAAAFEKQLFELARAEFDRAVGSVPLSAARRPRAVAFGERALTGASRRLLTRAFPPKDPTQEGARP